MFNQKILRNEKEQNHNQCFGNGPGAHCCHDRRHHSRTV